MKNTEEIERRQEELHKKIRSLKKEIEKYQKEINDLVEDKFLYKILKSDKYLGKYLRINNDTYVYVADIGCEYNSSLCGIAGPSFTVTTEGDYMDYFSINWKNDSYHCDIWINERSCYRDETKVEEITKEEFEEALREQTNKVIEKCLSKCEIRKRPSYLFQSEHPQVLKLRSEHGLSNRMSDEVYDKRECDE